MTTVWIYVDTNKGVGDPDHLKVFATPEADDEWFKDNDPEGVVFGYEVLGSESVGLWQDNWLEPASHRRIFAGWPKFCLHHH
jgi:hypothetical protein